MGEKVDFKRAYYIKLGRGGEWEQSSISESKLRLGWGGQSIEDINSSNWERIGEQLRLSIQKKGKAPKVVNREFSKDLNALQRICKSTSDDLWITFFQDMMWWCRLGAREIYQDNESKYRLVDGKWSNQDVCEDKRLDINSIPGVISAIRRFQGTVCKVHALETLRQLVNNDPGPEYKDIAKCNTALVQSVEKGIRVLNPKDFETFVDLVFRESGWRRLSPKGETMKYIDLELEDPITKERYQVQIKSKATRKEFDYYAKQFNPKQPLRWFYFVVHSPNEELKALNNPWPNVKLIGPGQLSEMVVRLGLVDWLMSHIK